MFTCRLLNITQCEGKEERAEKNVVVSHVEY